MKIPYEDLISGDSVYVEGIGHVRSPLLKELKPTEGVGYKTYGYYLSLVSWDKEDFVSALSIKKESTLKKIMEADEITVFDAFTIIPETIETLQKAMSFFMTEKIEWSKKDKCFYTFYNDDVVGRVDRENYGELQEAILQLNYINLSKRTRPITNHTTAKSKELWEKAQQYLKQEGKKQVEDKKMNLGNIISKLCVAGAGYNLLNIYNLTIFQLYDQFFQYGYMRAMKLNDMVFSNHGGKKFDLQAWLKPISKN